MSQPDYEKALKQIETGDLAEALQNLDRLLKKNPKFAPAYRPRAQVRAKFQDFKGAIADYKEAMRLQPTAMSFGKRVSIQSQIIDLENAIVQACLVNTSKHLFRCSSTQRAIDRSIAGNIQQLCRTSI